MATPEEPTKTPPDPEQRKAKRPWNWILITALAAVLVIAGAILGAAELVSSHNSDSPPASSQPANISNNNTNQNTNKNSQTPSQQGSGQGGGQTQSQAVIVPSGPPTRQGTNLQQRVKIEINNTVTVGVKVFYQGGWYVIAGPCRYSAAEGGCTGQWIGTQRPPGYGPGVPPMNYRQQPLQPGYPGQPQPTRAPSSAPTGFLVPATLAQSVANEQKNALAAAPASNYNSPDNATVTVNCTLQGNGTFSCTGSDSDGDTGAADIVTVAANGSSWSDSGMTWTGPDVNGSYTTPAVTNYSGLSRRTSRGASTSSVPGAPPLPPSSG
jgi:hypothetical protein